MRVDTENPAEIDDYKDVKMEESSKGKAEESVSLNYFLAGAERRVLVILVLLLVFVQMLASGADYWVAIW